jgi:RNA polymerase sigma-B factor
MSVTLEVEAPLRPAMAPGVKYRPREPRPAKDSVLERRLLQAYYDSGDLALREELVSRFLPFARDLAGRYSYMDEPFDDLLQVASMGLIKAIDRYEPQRGSKFTSYAAPTILGELKRYFRDKGWALHMPRGLQERTLLLTRETERLSKELARSPTVGELANATGHSIEEVIEGQEAATAYGATSLDMPLDVDESATPLVELIGAEDDHYELVEGRVELAVAWRQLPEIQREVLRLRFIEDLTQREIGERIGFSQMHVSRLLRQVLTALQPD